MNNTKIKINSPNEQNVDFNGRDLKEMIIFVHGLQNQINQLNDKILNLEKIINNQNDKIALSLFL